MTARRSGCAIFRSPPAAGRRERGGDFDSSRTQIQISVKISDRSERVVCLRWACLAALLAFSWVWGSVELRFGGNWTGLFCVGSQQKIPPNLRASLFVFRDSTGYDGQFYYYIAHDPFMRERYASYVDAPRLRYRRILVPAAAWALALGNSAAIKFTYLAVVLASVLAGAYWTGRFTKRPPWAIGFLLVPATFISLDRMTVDATLVALTAGFSFYAGREPSWKLYAVLVLATLTRETGFLLIAAFCVWLLWEGQWRRVATFATAAVPSLLWALFIQLHTHTDSIPAFTWIPLRSWTLAFLHPLHYYRVAPLPEWVLPALDRLELIGGLLAIAYAVKTGRGPVRIAAVLFGGLAAWHGLPGTWLDCFGYTRSFGPMFLLTALDGKRTGAALTLPRTLVQLAGQLARAVFGW